MTPLPANFYRRWREQAPGLAALREGGDPAAPCERLLQLIWLHQRLRRDALRLLDGRALTVLHPGFWNLESGPDFRGAVIQIDAGAPGSGDVEVDLRPDCWRRHRHDTNPAFRGVRLHVVWEGAGPTELPTLALEPVLDAPLRELEHWLASDAAAATLGSRQAGQCGAPLGELDPAQRAELLRQAAHVRFERKADWFAVRARDAGWEQALWEGLFGALGYKRNSWPMRRLAELRPEIGVASGTDAARVVTVQGRLFGLAGFLSAEPPRRPSGGSYWRSLWDVWWRERAQFEAHVLPRSLWRMDGIRPANHPQRRLALASHWLAGPDRIRRLEAWLSTDATDRTLANSLLECLQVDGDPFWGRHWTLNSRLMAAPHPLLGLARSSDLAVNVILPWFWSRARAGDNPRMQARIEQRYFAWPPGEDNAVLRGARRRLFGSAAGKLPRTAAMQQGLIQIVRDFCDHANAICDGCRFPDLVDQLGTIGSPEVSDAT